MDRIIKILESWKTTLCLLAVYAAGMAVATFIEASYGTAAARAWVYNSWWFYILHIILIANFVFLAMRMNMWKRRRFGALILHCGFIVMIVGAFITNIWGYDGQMHIREGESSSVILLEEHHAREVPFSVKLNKFNLVRYKGSNSPSSYESDVTITYNGESRDHKIFMNNIARVGGFRIYQTSYDADEKGTILTVNSDAAGTAVTYTGYFLLFLGLVLALFEKGSRFRTIYSSLGKKTITAAIILIAVMSAGYANAQGAGAQQTGAQGARTVSTINAAHAKKFSELLVQSPDGRIEPVNSYSSEILRKIYHRDSYKGMNSDQVLLGILSDPSAWSAAPIIYIGSKEMARELGAEGKHISYLQLFDEQGNYRMEAEIDKIYRKAPEERNKRDKELIKIDEKANIIYSLLNGTMMPLFPTESGNWISRGDLDVQGTDPGVRGDYLAGVDSMDVMFISKVLPWYAANIAASDYPAADEALAMFTKYQKAKTASLDISPYKIKAELVYNRADIFRWAFRLYLIAGVVLMFVLVSGDNLNNPGKAGRLAIKILTGIIIAVFAFHTAGMALRWYISGRAPWSNGYETMVYVAWATLLAGLLFSRKSRLVLALTTMLAGVVLFVSNLNWLDPQITNLVPVLKSHWLMTHVSVITASYGFFGMSFMCGIASLIGIIRGKSLPDLRKINELSMNIGLVLLTAGIFFGAIWANESWGRYWGWDPKETWALITMIVYAFITHSRFVPKLNNEYAFASMSVLGLLSVGMTFFGVNYYLTGLHSYGNTGGISGIVVVSTLSVIFILITVAGLIYKKREAK